MERSVCHRWSASEGGPSSKLLVGLDLSRKRIDVCLIDDEGEVVGEFAVPADADGIRGLVRRVGPVGVRAVIESMSGARFVHDSLEQLGWEVLIADAQKVKGLAPLASRPTGSMLACWRSCRFGI